MKDKKGKKGKGFYEEPDPRCIVKGKPVARKHHEVAVKKEAGEALNKPMKKGESKEAEKEELHIVIDLEKLLNLRDFCDKNRIKFRIDESFDIMEGVAVYITPPEAKAECDALIEFIDKNRVAEGVIEDNSTSSDLAPKVIQEKVVVFQHEKPVPQALLTDFCKEFNTGLNEDENRKKISINRKDAGSLQEFMEEHGIELEEIEDEEMEQVHLDTAEQVVEEVQSRRKESAKAIDSSRTAKNVGDKEDAEALVDWVKNPGKSDLAGIDTKGAPDE